MSKVVDPIGYSRAILLQQERENKELREMLKRTQTTIDRTKRHLEYLERVKVWTVENLYER